MTRNPRIVFFGTPEFAVASLDALVRSGFDVVAVVTAPDKPAGRGLVPRQSAVKQYAMENGIPVLQPLNLKDPLFLEELRLLNPDIQIVIAFRMLPRAVWELPERGTFNLHASLLPQYRGAAPINRAIMNGETETGVTTFFINDQIDTGKIILVEKIPVSPYETAGELHDRLMEAGAKLVVETVSRIVAGTVIEQPQDMLISRNQPLRTAPKIFKEDCRIDWTRGTTEIFNQIRGLSPYPAAFTSFADSNGNVMDLKIFQCTAEISDHDLTPGTIFSPGKMALSVATADGLIRIQQLRLQGRKLMNIDEFMRGYGRLFSEIR